MINQEVLVTGATGFVGQAVCQHLLKSGFAVRRALRKRQGSQAQENSQIVGEINGNTDWSQALVKIDSIVHLAARVHTLNDSSTDPLREFRKVNVEGTVNLARQATQANIRRFIFISSIKVNGEKTEGKCFTECDDPVPRDPYGISKFEAEQELRRIAAKTGLEIVILRPPLMYGPMVKANFYQLMNAIYRGWPLPLGGLNNQRSLLYVDTLADAIKTCLTHPNASGNIFLVSDEQAISTPDLVLKLAHFLRRPPHLLNVPISWIKLGGKCVRKSALIDRLTSSLVIDSNKIRRDLNWSPPCGIDLGIQKTTEWFLASKLQRN
jgi:nucleoside-diphosphate-sugar epimerase